MSDILSHFPYPSKEAVARVAHKCLGESIDRMPEPMKSDMLAAFKAGSSGGTYKLSDYAEGLVKESKDYEGTVPLED